MNVTLYDQDSGDTHELGDHTEVPIPRKDDIVYADYRKFHGVKVVSVSFNYDRNSVSVRTTSNY